MLLKQLRGHHAVHRVEIYLGLLALAVAIAIAAEMLKTGHFLLGEALSELWHTIMHFLSEVASAEVGATILVRLFGVFKD